MTTNKKKMGLTTKVLIGLVIGLIVGIMTFNLPDGTFKNVILIDGIYLLLGQIFLRGIMMMVVPLVFISLVNGATSVGDVTKLGRIGVKTISFYLFTTAIAVIIALTLGYFLEPGVGLKMTALEIVEPTINERTPLIQIVYEIIPDNPFKSMVEGNMLQIIIFALLIGVSISILGEKAKNVMVLLKEVDLIIMKIVEMIMGLAPIGVFALMARTMSTVGVRALLPLGKYMGTIYLGLAIQMIFVYGTMLKILTDFKPKKFYKDFAPAMSIAFSTANSSTTVPVSMEILEEKMGISRDISSFTIPLGATINMDGTAIMQGVAVFFIAQVYNIPVTFQMIATVVITATLASIGTAGVPGAGLIMLSMVFQSVGLPVEGIGLIMGIDRIIDMGRTVTNITGDAVCTAVIATQEDGLIDVKKSSNN